MTAVDTTAPARDMEQQGDLPGALAFYARGRHYRDAARVAWNLGKASEAADFSVQAGMHFEAGVCYQAAGLNQPALHQLIRTPSQDPRYRDAAVRVVELSSTMGALGMRVDTFLAPFLMDAPKDARELTALLALCRLYQKVGMLGPARRTLSRILALFPGHAEAGPLLAMLPVVEDSSAAESALAQERSFRQRKRSATGTTGPLSQTGRITNSPPVETGATQMLGIDVDVEEEVPHGAAFEEGTIVADRYRLIRKLGQGGMAVVFEARDLDLGEILAIKLHNSVLASADQEARFKREVVLSRRLMHANIIRVYDIGRIHGHKYMTMELLAGTDLDRTVKERGTLEVTAAVGWLKQVLAGLGYAHSVGVVHRDIKPANFFVHQGTVVKLMDFGISRDTRSTSTTSPGLVMGTPEYMAPEQFTGFSTVTPAADLYSVGIMAFRMLAGDLPYRAPDALKLGMMHAHEPIPSLRARNPAVPEAMEALVTRLLSKAPTDRYQTCEEVVEVLGTIKADAPPTNAAPAPIQF